MSDEADVMKLNMSVVWLNSLCLIGVPLCHACPLQLTVNLLQILSCSDVSIYIHVYLKQTEYQFHPFEKTMSQNVLTPPHLSTAVCGSVKLHVRRHWGQIHYWLPEQLTLRDSSLAAKRIFTWNCYSCTDFTNEIQMKPDVMKSVWCWRPKHKNKVVIKTSH